MSIDNAIDINQDIRQGTGLPTYADKFSNFGGATNVYSYNDTQDSSPDYRTILRVGDDVYTRDGSHYSVDERGLKPIKVVTMDSDTTDAYITSYMYNKFLQDTLQVETRHSSLKDICRVDRRGVSIFRSPFPFNAYIETGSIVIMDNNDTYLTFKSPLTSKIHLVGVDGRISAPLLNNEGLIEGREQGEYRSYIKHVIPADNMVDVLLDSAYRYLDIQSILIIIGIDKAKYTRILLPGDLQAEKREDSNE